MDCEVLFDMEEQYEIMNFIETSPPMASTKIFFNTSKYSPTNGFNGSGWKRLRQHLIESSVLNGFKLAVNGGNSEYYAVQVVGD